MKNVFWTILFVCMAVGFTACEVQPDPSEKDGGTATREDEDDDRSDDDEGDMTPADADDDENDPEDDDADVANDDDAEPETGEDAGTPEDDDTLDADDDEPTSLDAGSEEVADPATPDASSPNPDNEPSMPEALGEQRPDLAGPSDPVFIQLSEEDMYIVDRLGIDLPKIHWDATKNAIVCQINGSDGLMKLDDKLNVMWEKQLGESFNPTGSIVIPFVGIADCAVTPEGEIYVAANQIDVTLVKYDGTGEELWKSSIATSGQEGVRSLALAPNGDIYATGTTDGQMPGQPAELVGEPFLIKFSSVGEVIWTRQIETPEDFWMNFPATVDTIVNENGDVFLSFGVQTSGSGGLMKLTSEGEVEWATGIRVSEENGSVIQTAPSPSQLGLHEESGTIYSLNFSGPPWTTGEYPVSSGLAAYTQDGALQWFRNPAIEKDIIDPVEGVEWTGVFASIRASSITMGVDAIYIVGEYLNTFEFGAIERPDVSAGFVARYDLEGSLVWFRQLTLPDERVGDLSSVSMYSVLIDGATLIVTGKGEFLETLDGFGGSEDALIMVCLDAEDGHRL